MLYIISNPGECGGGYILAAAAQTVEQAIQCACDCLAADIKLHGASCGYIIADEQNTFARVLDPVFMDGVQIIRNSPPRRTSETVRRSIIAQRGFFTEGSAMQ